MQQLRQSETHSEHQHMNTRQGVFAALVLFAFVLISDFAFPVGSTSATLVKLFAGLGVISLLAKTLVSGKNAEKRSPLQINEPFETKAVTYLLGSPDEIATALTDVTTRISWDPNVKSIEKSGEDTFKIQYEGANGSIYAETIKYNFILDKEGGFVIQELVNNESYRYYELQGVQNRPYFLRVTAYQRVTPALFQARGKDSYRAVNLLRNYVSQSNRQGELQLVFKKNEDNVNEIFASLQNAQYSNYIIDSDVEEEEGSFQLSQSQTQSQIVPLEETKDEIILEAPPTTTGPDEPFDENAIRI